MTEENDNIPSPDDPTLDPKEVVPTPPSGPMGDPLIGSKIGTCTIKRLVGSGGMGTVYEAMQEKPRRRVALKIMKRGITSRSALRRFELESQILARLQHPSIAQVYEAGTHDDGRDGVPYFVMEFVSSAKTLTEYATDKGLGTRERLAIFSKVCDAVQHGHLKGIIHRDLKPSNILVNANGEPKIIDFGVARTTDSDLAVTTLQTDVGQLIGTLQYMSPEQCEADPSDIDARSDVYALGVTLYELLAGRPPYNIRKVAIHEAVRILSEEEPTSLSSFGKHLRGDIEKISRKSLEKNRDHRYQSVVALREDIQSYLDGEKISAKSSGNAWGTQAKMDLNFENFVAACLSRKTLCVFLVLCTAIWPSLWILERLIWSHGLQQHESVLGGVPNYWLFSAQAISFITVVLFLVYLLSSKSSHDIFALRDKIVKHKWITFFLLIYCPICVVGVGYWLESSKDYSEDVHFFVAGLAILIPLAIWLILKVAKPKIHFHSNGEQKSIPASESAVRTLVKNVVEKRQKVEGEQTSEKPPGITWDSALGEARFDGENFELKIPDKKLLIILLAISSVLVFVKLFFFSFKWFEMLICLCPLIAVTGLICLILGFKSSKIIKLACAVLCVFILYLTVSLIMHWVWKGRVFEFSGSVLPPSEISTPRISGSWLEVEDDIEMNPQIVIPGDLVTFRETSAAQLGTPMWLRLDGGEIHGADQWEATTTFSKVGDVRVRFSSKFMGDIDELLEFTISVKGTELSILPTYSKYFDDITIIGDFTDFVKDSYEIPVSLLEGFVMEANLDDEQIFSVKAVGNIQPASYEWQLLKAHGDGKFNELDENGDSLELQLEPGIYKVKVRAALDLYDRVVLTDWTEIDVLVETEMSSLFRKVFTEIGHPFAPELWNAAPPHVAYLDSSAAQLLGIEPGFYIGTLTMMEQEPVVSFFDPQELLEWLSEQDQLSSVQKEAIAGRVHLLDAAKKAYDVNDELTLQEMLDSLWSSDSAT